ncbi:MAG: hypothetical protein DLM63_01725 [Solirubrobacterales bacterium]|nr:MAG: hypothetical protein DLM63_01725 [Solirubrobacterales bacterium]
MVAVVALVVGVMVGAGATRSGPALAQRFGGAWEHGDYLSMYEMLSPSAKRTTDATSFQAAYARAAATATVSGVKVGRAHGSGSTVTLPVTMHTRLWGTIHGVIDLPVSSNNGTEVVNWSPDLAFPGLRPGETLTRQTQLPTRASILARDGRPLAQGPQRSSSLPATVTTVVGALGPAPSAEAAKLRAEGYPEGARVGTSGLEQILEPQLAGTPGGTLQAGGRTIASATPVPAHAVRTTIDPVIQEAAEGGLARVGGIVVLKPDGEVLALAGLATDTQPPGSTFKMITASAALEAHAVTLSTVFPFADHATLSGVTLANANGEVCGGTFLQAFAVSCNSVFAPLGAKIGATQLVRTAERFGFNQPSDIPGAPESTIPQPSAVGDDLAVGSTAIGQARVLATPLEMALIAATISDDGRRPRLTLLADSQPHYVRAISPSTARLVRRMMIEVVRSGTGTSAQIPGVVVAGKTGTAELVATQGPTANPNVDPFTATDAWFAAFAPALAPRVVIGVMFPQAGAGGTTAAPVAQQVLVTALGRKL